MARGLLIDLPYVNPCDMCLKDSRGRNGWQLCLIKSLHRFKILLVDAKWSFWTCIVYILILPCLACILAPPWVHRNFVDDSISPLLAQASWDEASEMSQQELARVRCRMTWFSQVFPSLVYPRHARDAHYIVICKSLSEKDRPLIFVCFDEKAV